MQISPASPTGSERPSSSLIAMSMPGSGRPMVPLKSVLVTGLLVPIAQVSLMPQPSIIAQPVTSCHCARRAFGGRHAAGLRDAQLREVDGLELRVVQQGIEQRVHGGEHVERPLLQHLDELADVARIGHQRQVRAPADRQQAQRQREDVIQRQRGDAVDLGRGRPPARVPA